MPPRQAQDQDDFAAGPRSVDLLDYWSILRRRWRLVLAGVVLGVLLAAAYVEAKGPTYTATAQVVVEAVTEGPLNQSTQATSQVNMSTEQAIAQSAPVIVQAAKTLAVPVTQLETEAAKRLSVTVPASTLTTSNVLQINWAASSPRLAQQGADAFASAYLSYRHAELSGQIASLESTLQRQTTSMRSQISALSAQLSKTSATSARRILTIRLDELTSQASTAQSQLAALPTYNDSGGSVIPAVRPGKPSGFGRPVILAIGLVLGVLIGLAIAFGRDLLDDRVRDADQLEQRLDAIGLAVLSLTDSAGNSGRGGARAKPPVLSIATYPDSPAAEAVRALRATVVAVSARRDRRVLLVAAADASMSSGRVAAELGVALAESGRRVLLLATDLRGSVLPQIFDIPNTIGLSELLIKGGDAEVLARQPRQASGSVLPTEVAERLTVLPSGQRTMLALPVLDSRRMEDLLRAQRKAHDYVLLDAPPATASDILAIASHVDGVIVLARAGQTKGKDVQALRQRLDQVGTPVFGGVLVTGRPSRHWQRSARSNGFTSRPAPAQTAATASGRTAPPDSVPPPDSVLAAETRPLPVVIDEARSPAAGGALKQQR